MFRAVIHIENLDLRVLVLQEGDYWVAQCLEHDVAAQGKTPKQLAHALNSALVGHAAIAQLHREKFFENMSPAPKFYHELYDQAELA